MKDEERERRVDIYIEMGWAGGWDGYWKVKAVGNDIEMEARACGATLEGDGK